MDSEQLEVIRKFRAVSDFHKYVCSEMSQQGRSLPFISGNGYSISWGDIEEMGNGNLAPELLEKFKMANLTNQRYKKSHIGGNELAYLSISKTETVEITLRDIEIVSNLNA